MGQNGKMTKNIILRFEVYDDDGKKGLDSKDKLIGKKIFFTTFLVAKLLYR